MFQSQCFFLFYNIGVYPEELGSFYTFNGEKLRKTVENSGTVTKTDYCGPFVYQTASGIRSLNFIITTEGRAVKNGSAWEYKYNLTDHLGNVRTLIKPGAGAKLLKTKN